MAVAVDEQIQTPQVQEELQIVKLEEDSHWEQEIFFQGSIPEPETSCQHFWYFHYQEASGPREALHPTPEALSSVAETGEVYERADPGVASPGTVPGCPSPGDPDLG